jgi:hypothetical protein
MAATTSQLNALANDGVFRQRARTLILQICAQVYGEDAQCSPMRRTRRS